MTRKPLKGRPTQRTRFTADVCGDGTRRNGAKISVLVEGFDPRVDLDGGDVRSTIEAAMEFVLPPNTRLGDVSQVVEKS